MSPTTKLDLSKKVSRSVNIKNIGERLVLFADLDLTLFDQTKARRKASSQAISALDLAISPDEARQLYKTIVDHWKVFELIGLPNFKLQWNSPELYEVLIALVAMRKEKQHAFERELQKIDERISCIENSCKNASKIHELEQAEIRAFEQKPETKVLKETLLRTRKDHAIRKRIKKACQKFEMSTKQLMPLKDARDFISTMSRLGIDLYVVTEGDPSVQLDKIKKLGLNKLIRRHRVLIVQEKSKETYLGIIRSIQAESRNSVKLAIVGDRYDKDIAPLIELFGDNVVTIRLLYGKYKSEYNNDVLEREGLSKPKATVKSIGQAKKLLMKRSLWDAVQKIPNLG